MSTGLDIRKSTLVERNSASLRLNSQGRHSEAAASLPEPSPACGGSRLYSQVLRAVCPIPAVTITKGSWWSMGMTCLVVQEPEVPSQGVSRAVSLGRRAFSAFLTSPQVPVAPAVLGTQLPHSSPCLGLGMLLSLYVSAVCGWFLLYAKIYLL